MRKIVGSAVAVVLLCAAAAALAGNPHFVYLNATRVGNSLQVDFKEAGLGNEAQVEIRVSATAACVNPGGKRPKAENKTSVSATGTFPVQNGKAEGTLYLTPQFQPDCSPPMSVVFSNVTVSDVTNGITRQLPGTY